MFSLEPNRYFSGHKMNSKKQQSPCPPNVAADCPFRGCGKRPGAPKRSLDMMGDCFPDDCPKQEVEDILKSMEDLQNKTGAHGTFKLAFTLPEAKARMALAIAVSKLSIVNGRKSGV